MPKIVDKQEKRGRILDSAIRVMAKKGVNTATISDIASAAGVGKGTIYEYFRSKDEILAASFAHFMTHVETTISRRLERLEDPLDRLLAYFEAWKEVLESESLDYLEIVLDFWAECLRKKRDIPGLNLKAIYQEYRQVVMDLLDDCIAAGRIRPVDTRVTASVLLGTMDGLLLQYIVDRSVFDIQQAVDKLFEIVMAGLKC